MKSLFPILSPVILSVVVGCSSSSPDPAPTDTTDTWAGSADAQHLSGVSTWRVTGNASRAELTGLDANEQRVAHAVVEHKGSLSFTFDQPEAWHYEVSDAGVATADRPMPSSIQAMLATSFVDYAAALDTRRPTSVFVQGDKLVSGPTRLVECQKATAFLITTVELFSDAPCLSMALFAPPSEGLCRGGDRECFLKCEAPLEAETQRLLKERLGKADCSKDAEFQKAQTFYNGYIAAARGSY